MSQTQTFQITPADQARDPYFYVPVVVPEGTTRIDVQLDYPKAEDCIIDLGCLDCRATDYPSRDGFRGWSGGARDRFFVAVDDATPGYVHGEIPAGEWHVMLGLYKIPEGGTSVSVTVTLDDTVRTVAPQPVTAPARRSTAGWYKGDLHCHTFHSDAKGSPETLHAAARQAGLDFLAVSDHNTTTQRRYFGPASSDELVYVRAMEVTTATGHANVFGTDQWIDFRMTQPDHAHTLARMVHEEGGLLSINHDKPDIPWDYEWPDADLMEVWQSAWLAWNWVSLERYQQRLASGLTISAIGGSDYHQSCDLQPEGPFVLARPTTVLWLESLSESAILDAMKTGRGYITESPTGPHLELTCDGLPMGTKFDTGTHEIKVAARGAAGDELVLFDATGEIARVPIQADDWTYTSDLAPHLFLRCEIIARASRERLITQLHTALAGLPLPFGLTENIIDSQPIRRALSNPVYFSQPELSC